MPIPYQVLPGTINPSLKKLTSCGLANISSAGFALHSYTDVDLASNTLPVSSLSLKAAEFIQCSQAATHTRGGKQHCTCQYSQFKSSLHFICNHFCNGKGGGSSRRRGISDMENSASNISRATIKYEVIYQISIAVQRLSSHSRGTPAKQRSSLLER